MRSPRAQSDDDVRGFLRTFTKAVGKVVDIQDAFVFGGLGMMGYGLYQFRPWVAYTVVGAVLFLLGQIPSVHK